VGGMARFASGQRGGAERNKEPRSHSPEEKSEVGSAGVR